ncbi:MAG: SDR family oxidoreductase [Pseudomonadota bacterium]
MPDLNGKVAIVTGGAASIGAAITERLCEDGATVVVAARNAENGKDIEAKLNGRAKFVQSDITVDEQLDRLITQTLSVFGKLDILVNNACSYGDNGAATDRATWLQTLNTNAVSAAILGEKARPSLSRSAGSIINIGSISGNFPHIARWAYPVSKATLRHLTKTQAVEYASDRIRVNMVTLGHIWSDPFQGLTSNRRSHADAVSRPYNLMGRIADADEVAAVVAFVASNEASYVTGSEIPVDGGYGAMGPEQHYPLIPRLTGEAT